MILNNGAFLFDNQNLFEPLGKIMGQPRFQRPWHANFEHPDANFGANGLGNTYILKRLHDIEACLARRDDAKARVGAIQYDAIEAVDPGKLAGRVDFIFVEAELLLQRLVGPSGVHAVGGQFKFFRDDDVDAVGINVSGNSRVHVFRDGLQADPTA